MYHLTISLSKYFDSKTCNFNNATVHLKRGYYSTNYPSQSGSFGVFLEHNFQNNQNFAGYQVELVWHKCGRFRFSNGWGISTPNKNKPIWEMGYISSYLPWVCCGYRHDRTMEKDMVFFMDLEIAPFLHKYFGF